MTQLAEFSDYQRVYLDETGFDRYLFRPYARSLKGQIVKAQISGKRYSGLTKIRTRRRTADSTNSTEPIHLVLQHLRESFSLS
ncbi:TPA: hypothetical protein WIW84_001133 [Neisseria meningitidis]